MAAVAALYLCLTAAGMAQSQSGSQDAVTSSNPTPSVSQPRWTGGGVPAADAYKAANHPPQIHYFSLEHRSADQINAEDRALLNARSRDIANAAAIYGYDLARPGWEWDQAICPAFPGTVMVHYLLKYPDGSESLFTALIPRERGRVRIVPSLHRNAANYLPSVKDPHQYALFNDLVPAGIARRDGSPDGNWLTLGVCYAEMVGGRPNVPNDPGLDVAMIRAPVSTFRVDAEAHTREVQFPDRDGIGVYTIWTLKMNSDGRLISADNEDYATYVARVVKLNEPAGTLMPNLPEPAGKIVTPTVQPKVTVSNPPEVPHL
jgi:hypothetical protein